MECERCETDIETQEFHTEIVRRDFDEEPQPSKIEYLCGDCLEEYERFLRGSSPRE